MRLAEWFRVREVETVLLIILILLLVGALPTWPYNSKTREGAMAAFAKSWRRE